MVNKNLEIFESPMKELKLLNVYDMHDLKKTKHHTMRPAPLPAPQPTHV